MYKGCLGVLAVLFFDNGSMIMFDLYNFCTFLAFGKLRSKFMVHQTFSKRCGPRDPQCYLAFIINTHSKAEARYAFLL